MLAILGGLGAALAFAGATLCSSRTTRMIGPGSVLAWVTAVGLVAVAPFLIADGVPDDLDGEALFWLAVAGVGSVAGLLIAYAALRIGDVSLVAPILSIQGAIAALIAVGAGEELDGATALVLAVIVVGVVLAATAARSAPTGPTRPLRAAVLSTVSAVCFGASLYATGRVGVDLSVAWALVPARLLGVVAVAIPFALTGRLRLTRPALPLVVIGGLCEVAGFGLVALGARDGIATTTVLSSQFAALAAIAAVFLFGERLGPVRVAGIVVIGVGVAVLTAMLA